MEIISDPVLAAKFASESLLMDGHELSTKDKYRVYDAYVSQLLITLDSAEQIDSLLGLSAESGFCRDLSTANLTQVLKDWSKVDVSEYVAQMKAMLLALRHLSSKTGRLYPTFDSWLEAFDVKRTSVVVRPYVRLLKVVWETLRPGLFAIANTLFQYTSRLTLKDVDWINEEEIEKYKQFEESLKNQTYASDLLEEVRAVIRYWFRDFTFSGAQGQHGYGATAGVKRSLGTAAKYKDFLPTYETAILACWLDWWPEFEFWPGLTSAHSLYLTLDHKEVEELGVPRNADQHMKYNLVPKAFNKKRGVSMEPTSHMFMQKMLFGLLDEYFETHPECHIHLHDQEINRKLCMIGSANGKFATIDLSSASDSVTNTLVKYVFQDTILGDALQLCRTSVADMPDGTQVPLEKFAPMGSAVCFPVECIVFSAIVAVAQQRLGVDDMYAVYGDDIVCSTRVFPVVVDLLQQLNFCVNTEKSYGEGSDFTESCGAEAYKGFDVSPLRMSRKWDVCQLTPSTGRSRVREADKSTILSAAYDACNEALDYGFTTLRAYRIKQTLGKYPMAMFSHRADMGILTYRPMPYDERRVRRNRAYQRNEVLVSTVVSKTALGDDLSRWSKLCEEYAYTKRDSLMRPEDRIEAKCGAASTYVRTKWLPISDLL